MGTGSIAYKTTDIIDYAYQHFPGDITIIIQSKEFPCQTFAPSAVCKDDIIPTHGYAFCSECTSQANFVRYGSVFISKGVLSYEIRKGAASLIT